MWGPQAAVSARKKWVGDAQLQIQDVSGEYSTRMYDVLLDGSVCGYLSLCLSFVVDDIGVIVVVVRFCALRSLCRDCFSCFGLLRSRLCVYVHDYQSGFPAGPATPRGRVCFFFGLVYSPAL